MTSEIPLFKVFMAEHVDLDVKNVLRSGHVAQGPLVDELEQKIRDLLAPKPEWTVSNDFLLVNSGTSALHLAYHLAGVGPGDEVIVSPMTCAATITPLVHLGATIVWADVHPNTGLISVESVAQLLTHKTKAVVAIDWAGAPADYTGLRRVVPVNIPIIEDAAHAMLANRHGVSIALYASKENIYICWSLQAIKHLTTGDGGILLCPTAAATERARKLRWFGFDRRSSADFRSAQDLEEAGYKFHMNDIAAAIGLANIRHTKEVVAAHRQNASYLISVIEDGIPYNVSRLKIGTPAWDYADSARWIFTVRVPERAAFQAFMKEAGIATSEVHRRNDHQPAFTRYTKPDLPPRPGLDAFASTQVSIPCGWWLSTSDLDRIAYALRGWMKS